MIELKRDKSSDAVVGQILRYMGWVQKHLAENGELVSGLIIATEGTPASLRAGTPAYGVVQVL